MTANGTSGSRMGKEYVELSNKLEALKASFDSFEKLMNERDKRYQERDESQAREIAAALQSAKELTSASFSEAHKASEKTEVAQKEYNEVHNGLANKMDAQYKEMIPRGEYLREHQYLVEKINELRESHFKESGKQGAIEEVKSNRKWLIGLILTIALFMVGEIIVFISKMQ